MPKSIGWIRGCAIICYKYFPLYRQLFPSSGQKKPAEAGFYSQLNRNLDGYGLDLYSSNALALIRSFLVALNFVEV